MQKQIIDYGVFTAMRWIYPDSCVWDGVRTAQADIARNSDECFQILTDYYAVGGETAEICFSGEEIKAEISRLLPVRVPENCARELFTTKNYEEVKEFVTRRAPFDVYDVCMPLQTAGENLLQAGRLALYVRLNVKGNARPGNYSGSVKLTIRAQKDGKNDVFTAEIPVSYTIYSFVVPKLADSDFYSTNWLKYGNVAKEHGVRPFTDAYENVLKKYFADQLDMRCTHLMLPEGKAVYNSKGELIDYDFSEAEYTGNLALAAGYKYVMGGFVVRWKKWTDETLYLRSGNEEITSDSAEGKRRLELYFLRCAECVERNGWGARYLQCIQDEVEIYNTAAYSAVCKIAKKYMPLTKIHDPVETADAAAYTDIPVAKQVKYESEREKFAELQSAGREVWIYTCAFPAGRAMKRIIDLPLTAVRLPLWLCFKYGVKGFLCWGYNVYCGNPTVESCLPDGSGEKGQAGDGFIVYPGKSEPWKSVRGNVQRMAAYDYEILRGYTKACVKKGKPAESALALVEKLCRSFTDYETNDSVFYAVRKEILQSLR